MSTFDPRKNVLERLRDREKKRDWGALNKSSPVPHGTRRWSAESYKADTFLPPRKTDSGRHLPRLEPCRPASVDSNYNVNFTDYKETMIPSVAHVKQNDEFTSGRYSSLQYEERKQDSDAKKESKVVQANYRSHRPTYSYPPLPLYNSQARMPQFAPSQAYPHPPPMYPVPMIAVYPGYNAPWLMPHFGFPGAQQYGHTGHIARPVRSGRMTRSQAALVLQKYTRGWLVRKSQRFAPWRNMGDKQFAWSYVENLVGSFLREEIIPDILIDVLSHKNVLPVKDPRYKVSERVAKNIIGQEVTAFIRETAIGVFYSFTGSPVSVHDPVFRVSHDILNEVVKENAKHIVRTTLEEVVLCHMTITKTSDWLEDFILETIKPLILRVASEAIQEYQYEVVVYDIIDDHITPYLKEIVVSAWADVVAVDKDEQLREVRVYAGDHMLDALCLQHLLSQLTGENLSLYFRDYMDQTLDGVMCGLLTQQYVTVENERDATHSNSVMKKFHEDVFCEVALDVLIGELAGHLDEDIKDLTEQDKGRSRFEL